MHRVLIHNALGCPDDNLLTLTHLTLQMWGRDMVFDGVCVPTQGESVKFQLESIDCREVKWQLFSHHHLDQPVPFPTTDIVSFKIGQSNHRKSATLLTDHFGLTWNYNILSLRYMGTIVELD